MLLEKLRCGIDCVLSFPDFQATRDCTEAEDDIGYLEELFAYFEVHAFDA